MAQVGVYKGGEIMRLWKCTKDFQNDGTWGDGFGVGKIMTSKEWGEQALDWADNWSDEAIDNLKYVIETSTEQELIDWIADMWEIEIQEVKYVDRGAWGNLEWLCYLYYLTGKGDEDMEDRNAQRRYYRYLVEKDLGINKGE